MVALSALSRALGYTFQDERLLVRALTHKSYASNHNERLEFLGDSILNCTIAWALFAQFPDLPEGQLSRLRANLVNQNQLAQIASTLKLGDYLHLGEGELKSGGFKRPSILADALEAIFGAIALDAGFDAAAKVVRHVFAQTLTQVNPNVQSKDPKSILQEFLQGKRLPLPRYSILKVDGEAHDQLFEVACDIAELRVYTTASAPSRRAAEQQAAEYALAKLGIGHF